MEITDENGSVLLSDTRVAFCRCGASGNRPLCDNSHLDVDFAAPGTVDWASESDVSSGGTLTATPTPNGPLHVEGAFEMEGEEDGSTYRSDDAWLCRCGGSANKPFCDGTHAKIGFTTVG